MQGHKIPFALVAQRGDTPLEFSLQDGGVTFSGKLSQSRKFSSKNGRLVELKGELKGAISLVCDLSGDEFEKSLDESVCLWLSDGIYENDPSGEFLDVIECMGGVIDLKEICCSELELIRSDYHTKPNLDTKELKWQFQRDE